MTVDDSINLIRLNDLDHPKLPPDIAEYASDLFQLAAGLELTQERLMSEAVRKTGLDDFGTIEFAERLAALCGAIEAEHRLSSLGRITYYEVLTGMLTNRLLVQDYVKRHPEIITNDLLPPIIITGLPRSGTTHLQEILAKHRSLRYLPYWESFEPLPLPEDSLSESENPRRDRALVKLQLVQTVAPHIQALHEVTADGAHEEIQLLGIDISGQVFESMAPLPIWRDYYFGLDQHSSYEYLRLVLKVLDHATGRRRWVLKAPQHIEQLRTLADTFPEATFVLTHRDPYPVVLSEATMFCYFSRLTLDPVEPRKVAAYWSDRIMQMLQAYVRDYDWMHKFNTVEVYFHEFMKDRMGTIENICEASKLPLQGKDRHLVTDHINGRKRYGRGKVEYNAAAIGLDEASERAKLQFYSDRFQLSAER